MADEILEHYDDWRGRKADPEKHGGIRAASFACVVETLENLVFLVNANNFVSYFTNSMHYPAAESANMVTNFVGTSFLLTIFGGFLADSFLTRFTTFTIFCIIELLGLIMLTFQAHNTNLQPPPDKTPSSSQAAILHTGLYAMAIGIGGVKASIPTHGAEQLDAKNPRLIRAFFNWFFFSLCIGGLIAATLMVWIVDNKGWSWSFDVSAAALALGLCVFVMGFPLYRYKRPSGSPLTRIFKVLASAIRNRNGSLKDGENQNINSQVKSVQKFRFLDKASIDNTVSKTEVEETRTFLALLPIFGSTIMMNCCLAQIQTFSVEQGTIMNRKLTNSFEVPVQSLTIIPLAIMLSSIPLYEFFSPKINSGTTNNKSASIFEPLKRIGIGLALSSASMAAAAAVEAKRRSDAIHGGHILSVFWLGFQYLLLGVSDLLTLGGMLEFFYSEAPDGMRSMSSSLSWCSAALGYFLSTVLVEVTNVVSGRLGREWLGGADLNSARVDLFYVLLCVLNTLNLLNYIYWAKRYY